MADFLGALSVILVADLFVADLFLVADFLVADLLGSSIEEVTLL